MAVLKLKDVCRKNQSVLYLNEQLILWIKFTLYYKSRNRCYVNHMDERSVDSRNSVARTLFLKDNIDGEND